MLEEESSNCKDTVQGSKTCFLTTLLKAEILDNNLFKTLYEFLLIHELDNTAKYLIKEASDLGFKIFDECFDKKEVISEATCASILEEFKGGNWKKFFKLWKDSVPESIQSTMEYKLLTMKLRVHFAYLPVRSKISSKKLAQQKHGVNNSEDSFDSDPDVETAHDSQREASMNQLKEYLATINMESVDYKPCISFFGLPYLENPMTDPTVSYIFTPTWVDELKVSLKIFLIKHAKIVLPDEDSKPSPKNSATSTIIPGESVSKEQLEQYQKNLQILESFDLDSIEAKNTNVEECADNDILEFVKTSTEDLGSKIIGNDRNIPLFIPKVDLREEFTYFQKTEVKIKSTQTRIQGIKNTATLLAVDELSCPVKVLDAQNLLKSPKSSMKKSQEQLILTMTRFQNVHGNYQKLKLRFHQLHSDYTKLSHVTDELIKALENSLSGNSVNMPLILETCFTVFPAIFQKNLRADSKEELVFQSEDEFQTNQIKINHCFDMTPLSPRSIDFKKIKFHLTCGNLKTKLLLLQALRWKITFSQQGERDDVLYEYINNDLLGIRGNIAGNVAKQILPNILYSVEGSINILQQSTARLLNTIASLRCGRDYLSIGTTSLNAVVECLNGSNDSVPDAFTYDMLLAMLQKLSLRKLQRINMIEAGLVEWLIHHLNIDICKMSPYRLKYVTALLMNLSLHVKARDQVSSEASLILPLLMDLLLTENQTALPFISGALSNFLLNEQINEEGKRMGLESYLKYYRKRVSVETRQYVDHLIEVHKRKENIEEIDIGDNDDDECDLIEDELDDDDPIQNEAGELAGEMLLASCYVLPKNAISSELDKHNSDFILHKINRQQEIISKRFSKEKNQVRLKPVHTIPLIKDTDFTDLIRNECQIEGEEFSQEFLNPRNNSVTNLMNCESSEDIKPKNSSTTSPVTTIYQPQSLSINSEWSKSLYSNSEKILKNNSERNFRKQNLNSKLDAFNIPSKNSKNTNQSSIKTSHEEIDINSETSSEISKESSKMNTTSSSSFPSAVESLQEGPNEQSSIASVEASTIKKEEEEAFLAKPKIQRTPPQSAKLKGLKKLKNP